MAGVIYQMWEISSSGKINPGGSVSWEGEREPEWGSAQLGEG